MQDQSKKHPPVKVLLQERLQSRWYQILKREPSPQFLRALSELIIDELQPFDGDVSIDVAVACMVATVAHLQCAHYEAQSSLRRIEASKFGVLLDQALAFCLQLVEAHGGQFIGEEHGEGSDQEPGAGGSEPGS